MQPRMLSQAQGRSLASSPSAGSRSIKQSELAAGAAPGSAADPTGSHIAAIALTGLLADRLSPAGSRRPMSAKAGKEGDAATPLEVLKRENELLKRTIESTETSGALARRGPPRSAQARASRLPVHSSGTERCRPAADRRPATGLPPQ
jgi:hypothetical protein